MIQTEFISIFSARFSDYLAFRQLGGIEPKSQHQLLSYFDRFVHQQGFQKAVAIARTHRTVSRLEPSPPARYPYQSLIRRAPVLPLLLPV